MGESDMSGIIVKLVVSTGYKNPYHIHFPKTDTPGMATLTRGDFIGQFTDQGEAGIMDHSGTPEDAQSIVRVGLYDPSWSLENRDRAMAWPLLTHERTKWPSRDEEYRYRTSSRNSEFLVLPMTVDLENNDRSGLHLKRKNTAISNA